MLWSVKISSCSIWGTIKYIMGDFKWKFTAHTNLMNRVKMSITSAWLVLVLTAKIYKNGKKKAKVRKQFFKWSDHFRQYWFYILNTTKILWILSFLQILYNFIQYIYSQNDILTSFLNIFKSFFSFLFWKQTKGHPDSYDKVKVTFGRVIKNFIYRRIFTHHIK